MYRLLLLILFSLLINSCNSTEERIQPEYKSIAEFVYSSVIVQPDSLYQVYSAVNGILDKQLVEEGDLLNDGDALFQIINSNSKLATENARLAYKLAENNLAGNAAVLSEIKDEINTATLKLINDSIYFSKQENLWDQEIGSRVTYDAMKLQYETSKNSLEFLKNKYKRTQNELKTQLQQAENNYLNSLITTEDYLVTSKINGKVYGVYKSKGEVINTQEPLASIGSSSVFIIEMLVDEVDIVRLQKDQKVLVLLDAYEGQVFHANVHMIYPNKNEATQTFLVEARFADQPPILYPGLSGEANILIGSKDNALVIPIAYLVHDSLVKTENGLTLIKTGLRSMGSVEVLSGIDEKTLIYKPEK